MYTHELNYHQNMYANIYTHTHKQTYCSYLAIHPLLSIYNNTIVQFSIPFMKNWTWQ